MAINRKRQLKPGPPGKTSEAARYQLMGQGFNNAESCRILSIGRKTGSKWRKLAGRLSGSQRPLRLVHTISKSAH